MGAAITAPAVTEGQGELDEDMLDLFPTAYWFGDLNKFEAMFF